MLQRNADITTFFNECIGQCNFPFALKHANITPMFKKGYIGTKDNYRPVSILPNMSKIFEKLQCKLITLFMKYFLSKFQCGFRKGFRVQHCTERKVSKCRVFCGPNFPVFGLNTRKYGPEKTLYLDIFHTVLSPRNVRYIK